MYKIKQQHWDELEDSLYKHGIDLTYIGKNLNEQRSIFPSLRYMYFPEKLALSMSKFFFWLSQRWFLVIIKYIEVTGEADWFFEENEDV